MDLAINRAILRKAILSVFTIFCFLGVNQTGSTEMSAQVKDSTNHLASLSLSLIENNSYLSVAQHSSLSPPNALTVEAWVKPLATDGSQVIVDRLNQNANAGRGGYQLRIENGSVAFMVCPDNLRSRCVTAYGSTALQPNVWQHLAATFERGAMRVYLNGQLNGQRSKFVRSSGNAVGTLTIGANNRGGGKFRGLIDEIRISSAAIYQTAFAPPSQLEDNPSTVGWWRFESGATTDSSPHNHPTTMIGNAYFSPDVPTTPSLNFRFTPTPNVGPSNELVDVVTIAPNNVWSVGSHGPAGFCCYPKAPVSLNWNGAQWNDVPVPSVPGLASFILKSVDGNATSDVWAIGEAFDFTEYSKKFLLRYNGKNWTFAATINPNAPDYDIIRSISVINDNDIWIVGFRDGGASWTLHWDGTSLTTVPSPNIYQGGNRLTDVDAISSNEVWAVGDFMAIRWNGSVWQVVGGTPTQFTYLRSVAAIAPNNIWAVGRVTTCGPFAGCSSGDSVLNYNGASWTQVPIENYNPQLVTLNGISASAPNNVWVVGGFDGDSLVLRYDGTTLRRVAAETTPLAGASEVFDSLLSVSALNANEVWTVGQAVKTFPNSALVYNNLALRRSLMP